MMYEQNIHGNFVIFPLKSFNESIGRYYCNFILIFYHYCILLLVSVWSEFDPGKKGLWKNTIKDHKQNVKVISYRDLHCRLCGLVLFIFI